MPEISVIVPVYKAERFLPRCIESILTQTFTNFELILVDDGSPDNCLAICDEYAKQDSRIIVIHQENSGVSGARNAGLDWAFANSESKWVTFVDSDDWIQPELLNSLLFAVQSQHTNVSICGYYETADESLGFGKTEIIPMTCLPEDYYINHMIGANVPWGKLYSKECFRDLRYPIGKIHEDEFVTYRILFAQGQIAVIDAPLYNYYINEEGITKSPWNPNRLQGLEARKNQIVFFEEHDFSKAHKKAIISLLWGMEHQIRQLYEIRGKYQQILYELRRDMRIILRKNKKYLSLSVAKSSGLYEAAYPRLMNVYWYIQAALRKLHLRK